jgi:asparagine synthase (glutamine-hydrolysing)
MTGIAAIFSPAPVSPERLGRMMKALSLRKHDESATLIRDSLALGACVFHTTPESVGVCQPLANDDASLAVVLDGFLTNWEELRCDLQSRGAVLRNRSDAELVLRAYELWGEDCARRLDGEFAFVIADRRRHRLYCARDHLGLKPLFYYREKGTLLIASDIAAIIEALDQKPEPDHDFLADLIAGDVFSGEQTPWKGLHALANAHWLTCSQSGTVMQRYYELPAEAMIRCRSDAEYAEHHRAELFEAVRRASRSQAPLAVEVSGGLDSSAIFAVADRLLDEGRLPTADIMGYTLAGRPGTRAHELPYARAVAAHLGRNITEVPLFEPEREWYEACARTDHDVPPPTNGVMSINLEHRAAADGARALLSGVGGDEWLGGSLSYYREFARDRDLAGFVRALREDMAVRGVGVLGAALRMGAASFLTPDMRRFVDRMRRKDGLDGMADPVWLKPEWRDRVTQRRLQRRADLPLDFGLRNKRARFSDPWALYARANMHRQPAVNGLEVRFPMLSRQFVEFSAAIPEYARLRGGINKFTHRNAMRGLLPDLVVDRGTKATFEAPQANFAFTQFCLGQGASALSDLVDAEQMIRHFSFHSPSDVDGRLTWEIYGLYAAVCFLGHAGFESVALS